MSPSARMAQQPQPPGGPMIVPVTCIFCDSPQVAMNSYSTTKSPADDTLPATEVKIVVWYACAQGHAWGICTFYQVGQPVHTVVLNAQPDKDGNHAPVTWEQLFADKRRQAALKTIIVPGR